MLEESSNSEEAAEIALETRAQKTALAVITVNLRQLRKVMQGFANSVQITLNSKAQVEELQVSLQDPAGKSKPWNLTQFKVFEMNPSAQRHQIT